MPATARRIAALCCAAVLAVLLGALVVPTDMLWLLATDGLHDMLEPGKLPASGVDDDGRLRELTRLQAYRRYIFSTDMAALRAVLLRSRRPAPAQAVPVDWPRASVAGKVAFLFLLHDTAEQEAVWDAFFASADPALFSVYVHRTRPTENLGSFQGLENTRDVPYTGSAWCALMGLELAMLQAALRDPLNQQFVFLSHNTVPLKSFRYVYEDLVVESGNTSKFCFASQPNPSMGNQDCRFQDWNRMHLDHVLKHHQWIVLSRRHAEVLLLHAEVALRRYDSLREADARRPFRDIKMCSDETVPALALFEHATALGNASRQSVAVSLRGAGAAGRHSGVGHHQVVNDSSASPRPPAFVELEAIGVEQRCVTFAYWQSCLEDSPLDLRLPRWQVSFHPHDFRTVQAPYVRRLVNSSLLFARKFGREALVLECGSTSSERPQDVGDVEQSLAASASIQAGNTPANTSVNVPVNTSVNAPVNVSSCTSRPLAEVLPKLWEEVEFGRGARQTLVRLETGTGLDS